MAGEHALDPVVLVRLQYLFIAVDRDPFAPLGLQYLNVISQALRHDDPQMAELPEARREKPIAGRKGVGERRFPGAGTGRGEDEYLTRGGLEHLLQIAEQAGRQLRELGGAVILHCDHHRPLNAVGNIRGPGNEQEIAACSAGWHHTSPKGRTIETLRVFAIRGGSPPSRQATCALPAAAFPATRTTVPSAGGAVECAGTQCDAGAASMALPNIFRNRSQGSWVMSA